MRRKKQAKLQEEKFWASFYYFNGTSEAGTTSGHFKRINFRLWDTVTDEDIMRMNSRVTSVYQLDLDEAGITKDAVESLTQLDFITELRLKGIWELNDSCITYLAAIKGLQLLHVGSTSITLDGLLCMLPNPLLQCLLFSHEQDLPPADKMLRLKALFPACEFIVNHKTYYFKEDEWPGY